jgi:hypothetical protein
MDLHILRGKECNAFVMPLGGRCRIFITLGLVAAVLQASRLSVSLSELPALASSKHINQTIPEEFSSANAAAMQALGINEMATGFHQSRDHLALAISQAILDFILHHEFMHISMGHVAYHWKIHSDSGFLEFGNRNLSKEECKIRTSFEVAADAMAGALGCQLIFAEESPFESFESNRELNLELWAYSVGLMCHILWKLLSGRSTPEQLIQNTMTFEDASIHPDPIKRRFNIEAFVISLGDPDSAEGRARNAMVAECFVRGILKEHSAIEKTLMYSTSDPEQVLSFMRNQFHKMKHGVEKEKGILQRLFGLRHEQTLMRDPNDWIAEVHRVSDAVHPRVAQADVEFRRSFLRI